MKEEPIESKSEAIYDLLAVEGPLSTDQIQRRLNEKGIRINGTGQALRRLRLLVIRGRVERIEGERPGWSKWKVV